MNEKMSSFFARLKKLSKGERATLKRSAGTMLAEADGKALAVFYRVLPKEVPQNQEDKWFAVACIHCLWPADEISNGEPFQELFGKLLFDKAISESAGHRAEGLLDTDWDKDGFMLTKLTRLIEMIRQKTGKAPLDCTALLSDLLAWNNDSNYIRRKWAKAIFTTKYNNDDEKETTKC